MTGIYILTICGRDRNFSHNFFSRLEFWVGYFGVSFTFFGQFGISMPILVEMKGSKDMSTCTKIKENIYIFYSTVEK